MWRFNKMRSVMMLLALTAVMAAPAAAEEMKSSVKGDMLFWMKDAQGKLLELAEATPADKYSWSPAEGVRTTGQVFLHVAAANYGIPSSWGVKPPEGFDFATYESSMTKKEDIQAALKASFEHMEKSLEAADDAALEKHVNLFGMMDMSVRGGYMLILSHAHEHLGQSIAYARSNGITPPWTARQNAQIEAAQAKAKADGAKAKTEDHGDHKH